MNSQDVLIEAATIAREARTCSERAELEATVQEFERSTVPVLRSLARAYRMMQHPF